MHIGQAHVAATEADGELFVVDAEEMKHGGVEVVNLDPALDDFVTPFVGDAVNDAGFDAAAGRRDEADTAYAAARRLASSPQLLADWLRAAAANDEVAGRKEAALWNLDQAVAMTPDDWTLYAARAMAAFQAGQNNRATTDIDEMMRRGANDEGTIVQVAELAGGAGDWRRAATLFANIPKEQPVTLEHNCYLAIACLKAGDSAHYKTVCAGITERIPPIGPGLSRHDARRAARLFALQANATDDWNKPLAWIDHALVGLAAEAWTTPNLLGLSRQIRHVYLNTRGALLYRAGRCEEAVKTLREAMTFHTDGGAFHDWAILALVEHKLGHADAAKEAGAKARATQAKTRIITAWDKAEIELLASELDAALPVEPR